MNDVAKLTLDSAFRVHTAFGPGLFESAYSACLLYDLRNSGVAGQDGSSGTVVYQGVKMTDTGYRLDILVEEELVVEVKALEAIAPIHLTQLVTYLKLSDKRLGLLLNFNGERLRDGIYRRVNRF